LEHVLWLVDRFSEQSVIDPCCGTGMTLLACKELGREAIGIEIDESSCELSVLRLRQQVLPFTDDVRATNGHAIAQAPLSFD
jgi:DNA modification methylase